MPLAIDDQRGRVRDVDGVGAERVMEPVCLGHGAILIEQKRRLEMGCFSRNLPGFHMPSRFSAAMNANCAPAASISCLCDSN